MNRPAIIETHEGIAVVRDDLRPGGTKARFLVAAFRHDKHIVYASPACGGAQLALAYAAKETNGRASIFVAKRKTLHARSQEARELGAEIHEVPFGYLTNVQAKARAYAESAGARLLAFGADEPFALEVIAAVAAEVDQAAGPFDEVLSRGLQMGISAARFFAVRVGRSLHDCGVAEIVDSGYPFEREIHTPVPFPSCANYDRKAWEICRERRSGRALFWNVMGPSPTGAHPS